MQATRSSVFQHCLQGLKLFCWLFTAVFSIQAQAASPDAALAGLWQHESKPVVVEMKSVDGLTQGIVFSHGEKPDAVGKSLFRNLSSDAESQLWQGRIYVQQLQEERDVSVTLINSGQFVMTVKVGFISRKVVWNRIGAATPTAALN